MFAVIAGLWWLLFPGYAKPYYPCGGGQQAVYHISQTSAPGCPSIASDGGDDFARDGSSWSVNQ